MKSPGGFCSVRHLGIAALLGLGATCAAAADGDLIIFPAALGEYQWDGDEPDHGTGWDGEAGADLFGVGQVGRLEILGEALLTTGEQEIERAQIGWQTNDATVWLGRFHTPIGFWNTEYHHGAFLQPTIRRPGLVSFEDDGGVLPMHITGLLLQGSRSMGNRGFSYDLAAGLGPEYDPTEQGLEPLNLLHPRDGDQDSILSIRLAYQSEPFGSNQIGLFATTTHIPVADTAADELEQLVVGSFVRWEWAPLTVTSELYYIRTKLDLATGPGTAKMASGYTLVDYALNGDWSLYAQAEYTREKSGPSFLALAPEFEQSGGLAGIRFQFLKNQILKLEVARHRTVDDRYTSLMLEWSAIFP